jgi:diadenosine tetraphosphate (Ap4A) HIT family hydrolase
MELFCSSLLILNPWRNLGVFDVTSFSGCLLCDEVHGENPLSLRLGHYKTTADKVILETEHFLLLPDISPIVQGHILLISKDHLSCFAQLPICMLKEFRDVRDQAVSLIAATYSEPLLFEHGSSTDTRYSGVCVQHAHIHVIPVRAPVEEWLEEFGELVPFDLFTSYNRHDLPEDYLWYRNQIGSEYLVSKFSDPVPCQFIRRALARHLAISAWNWKSAMIRQLGEPTCLAVTTDTGRS